MKRLSVLGILGLIGLGTFLLAPVLAPPVRAEDATVQAVDNAFQPQTITVAAGTTITWTNAGKAPHTVTADDNSWDSGNLAPGQSFSHTFDQPATVGYHCQYHGAAGSGMFGTITVSAAQPAAAPTTEAAPAPTTEPVAAPTTAPVVAPTTAPVAAPTAAAQPQPASGPSITVQMSAQNDSGITGTATLSDLGDGR